MRLKKVDFAIGKKTLPAIAIAQCLLDLRNLCSNIELKKVPHPTATRIFSYLKDRNMTHLFQSHNFDNDLLQTLIRVVNLGSTKPAYIEYNPFESLEKMQVQVLKKFGIPCYPENEEIYLQWKLEQNLIKKLLEKRGEKNGKRNWE